MTGTTQQGRSRDDFQRWYGCDNGTLIRHYPIPLGPTIGSLTSPPSAIDPTVDDRPGVLFPPRPCLV
ncbi:MAG: hypothetical protein R3B96_04930 [Pirellulaceae bacterium]